MTPKEFFDKVVEMRGLQKNYFGTRNPFTLDKCKKAEKEIDDEIDRVNKIIQERNTPKMGNLF